MALGDIYEATAGDSTDLYYVDTEVYDVPEYGAVYVLDGEAPALIDTGIGKRYEVILDALAELGIDPEELAAIVPTHVHLDHAGGAGYLAEACPNADVYGHERGVRHLIDPERLWEGTKAAVGDQVQFYAQPRPVPEERITAVSGGDEIRLGDRALEVVDAPGHAPHQMLLYDPANDGAFVADAAGIYTPGLEAPFQSSPPPNFDLEQVLEDVERIRDLGVSALYYGHFGDHEPDGLLDAYASAVREWVAEVERVRETRDDEAVIEWFGENPDPETVEAWGPHKAREEARMNARGALGYLGE